MMRSLLLISLVCLSFGSYSQSVNSQVGRPKKNLHTPASADKVVMYEVFVRNFSKEGTFKGVTAGLKNIRAVGANTLWLMPIQPTGIEKHKGTYGSPYAIKDYMEVNPDYGTKEDLKQLVDSCHALGMNIIIDLVANHTSWDNVWLKSHTDWYTHDAKGNIVSPVTDWTDVADLNFDNKDMRHEMLKQMQYWIRNFDIDGYRCDVAGMVPLDFWKESIDSLNRIKYVIMLAEGDDPKLINSGFQITYGWDFYSMLKKVFKGEKPAAKLDSILQNESKKYPANARRLRFITNHDEDSWDNVPAELFGGIDGSKAAYVIMACLPGVPLVYNGQEAAYPQKINLFEKYTINYATNPALKRFYMMVLSLHKGSVAIRNGDVKVVDTGNPDIFSFTRTQGKEKIMVVVNVTNKATKYGKPAIITPTAKYLMGEKASPDVNQPLPAYGFQVIKL